MFLWYNPAMKKVCLLILLILFLGTNMCEAKHLHKEKYYQKSWCDKNHGQMEYRLDDGTRVDCLTIIFTIYFKL